MSDRPHDGGSEDLRRQTKRRCDPEDSSHLHGQRREYPTFY